MTDRRRRAGDRLRDAILSLQPAAYWPLDDAYGPIQDIAGSPGLVMLATSADADDIVDTATPHGMVAGDPFTFASLTGGSGVAADTPYFVIAGNLATLTFQFALTAGGAAVSFGSDITAGTVRTPWKQRPATVTGTLAYGVAAPEPIGRAVAYSTTGTFATTSGSVPTPAASVSALVAFATVDTAAANRVLMMRSDTNQGTWRMQLTTGHALQGLAQQSSTSTHCAAGPAGAVNDGRWHLALFTFDGTTAWTRRISAAGYVEATSTSLTGSWHLASTAGIRFAGSNAVISIAHGAYWADRLITATTLRWLGSIAFGG